MLPVLVIESVWKVLWLSLVARARARALAGTVDDAISNVIVNYSVVVVIIAVVPWGHVWRTSIAERGEGWRCPPLRDPRFPSRRPVHPRVEVAATDFHLGADAAAAWPAGQWCQPT
ncbi:hypothetical protein GCM10027517_05500 [Phycicoccus ginsengisoli]